MPVIVIGADTEWGGVAVAALLDRDGEVRAFVSDLAVAERLRARGVKVAIGDVSDSSHVGGAARRCFCAVVVPGAAIDGRERSFAPTPGGVVSAWAAALGDAGVARALWLDDGSGLDPSPIGAAVGEMAVISLRDRDGDSVAADIVRLDAAAAL